VSEDTEEHGFYCDNGIIGTVNQVAMLQSVTALPTILSAAFYHIPSHFLSNLLRIMRRSKVSLPAFSLAPFKVLANFFFSRVGFVHKFRQG
jgi:hypothetical protein